MTAHSGGGLFIRWVALCAIAELLGIAAAAIWYGAINIWVGEPGVFIVRIGAWLLMSLAAIPEGFVLGGLQSLGLRWFFPTVSSTRWILATVAVGLLGWGTGAFIPMFLVDETAMANGGEPGLAQTAIFAGAFGLGVGVIFGLAQAWALPPGAQRRVLWIAANAFGWAIGLPLIYVAARLAAEQSGWVARVVFWAAGGFAAGTSVGIATGIGLLAMARYRNRAGIHPDPLSPVRKMGV